MRKTALFCVVAATVCVFAGAQGIGKDEAAPLRSETLPDGSVVLENSLVRITVRNRVGGDQGIVKWLFKPTGHEMIDVLYGQTDYVKGHVCGEVWDLVKEYKGRPSGHPKTGSLLVTQGVGVSPDGSALFLVQQAQDTFRLTKTYILRRDSTALELRYALTNLNADPVSIGLRLHTAFSPGARGKYHPRDDRIYLETDDGVLELDQALAQDKFHEKYLDDRWFLPAWSEQPGRNWVWGKLKTPALKGNWAAQVRPVNGDGIAFCIPSETFLGYYNCPGITLEPVFKAACPLPGETWEATVFLGSFTGAKDRKVVKATPLFVVTKALALGNGTLSGELVPLFQGALRIFDGAGKEVLRKDARPAEPIEFNAPLAEGTYRIVAVDTGGRVIGKAAPDLTVEMSEPQVSLEQPRKPRVRGKVYLARDAAEAIRAFLAGRDFTVQCNWTASEEEKELAERIAGKLGLGLCWTDPRGKMLVIGTPVGNQTVREVGLVRKSVSADWPGGDKGALLCYDSFEGTSQPILLIAGSSKRGVVAAGALFEKDFLKDVTAPRGFDFWATTPALKVYPYHRPYLGRQDKLVVEMAKDEYEPAQCVITAYEDLHDIRVEVATPVHTESGKELGGRQYTTHTRRANAPVWLRWVNTWPIDGKEVWEGWTGYPDPLLERAETDLKAGRSQPIWLTFITPLDAEPGLYKSTVTCKVGDVEQAIPLEVRVWDFALPMTSIMGEPYMHLDNLSPDNQRELSTYQIHSLTRNFVEHGMRIMHLGNRQMFRWHFSKEAEFKGTKWDWLTVSDDGTIALDATYFDFLVENMDVAAQPFKLRYMIYAQAVSGDISKYRQAFPKRHEGKPKREGHWYAGYQMEDYLRVLRKHLEKRNMLDRTVLKLADEPRGFDWWYDQFTEAARNAGLPFMTCFNSIDWKQAERGLGKVAVWQPLYMHYDREFFAKAKKAGALVSWYNCGPRPMINLGATASEIRSYLWQAARCELDIVAWWGIQCWTCHAHQWTNRYAHHNSVVYPRHPKKPAWTKPKVGWRDTEPIDSIRWELIREGIEDHKYVTALRDEIKKAREAGRTAEADGAQATLDRIWRDVFPTLNDYNPPYETILECRRQIAAAIVKLRGDPEK